MTDRCLYCYEQLDERDIDFHPKCSRAFFGTPEPPRLDYTLDQMTMLAVDVLKRHISVPGVQPKLSLTLDKAPKKQGHHDRLTVIGVLRGNYILKPPHPDYPEMPQNEHLTMKMATAFGLKTVPSSLIRLASGELSYITKRIDRTGKGEKIHMLDMFQVVEAFDKYRGSMERIGKALTLYAENTLLDLLTFFELTLFCFLTGNNDMHLKNFSMICKEDASWSLAPAYDLLNVAIINPADMEELALTVNGRKSKFDRKQFAAFGLGLGLNARQIDGVFKNLFKNRHKGIDLIRKSFLSNDQQEKYEALMDQRYARLVD